MALTAEQVQKLYIAYFGRAADPSGYEYWQNSEWNYEQAANRFAYEPESLNRYEYLDKVKQGLPVTEADKEAFVSEVYEHLFNREPEPSGLAYWLGRLDELSEPDALVVEMLEGAQNNDALKIANKVTVAECYTDAAADGDIEYGEGSVSAGILDDVDETEESVEEAKALIDELPGEYIVLTEGVDAVTIDHPSTADTVKGVIDFDVTGFQFGEDFIAGTGEAGAENGYGYSFGVWGQDNSTFSVGDVIEGNGLTTVEVAMDVDLDFFGEDIPIIPWGRGDGGAYIQAEYVEMSGVDELSLVAAGEDGFVLFDASSYGDDISKVSLRGNNGMEAAVENLQADETLLVELDTSGFSGEEETDFYVGGTWNGLDMEITLENDFHGEEVTPSHVSLTESVIDVVAGNRAEADLELGLEATAFTGSGDAVSGDVVLGDINMTAGKSGEVDVDVYNVAWGEDMATSDNNAIAGDISIGNISMELGQYAESNELEIDHVALGEDGYAEVGDLSIGTIDVLAADHASFEVDVDQYAYGEDGKEESDATIGTLDVGDITVVLGDSSGGEDDDGFDSNEVDFYRSANASTSGDATVGDAMFGDISFTGGDDVYDADFYAYSYAYADEGDASIGDALFGDVNFSFGEGDEENHWYSFSAYRYASADETGDASVGTVTVGDISMAAGNGQQLWAYVYQYANADEGDASVGEVTVGDVTMSVGDGVEPLTLGASVTTAAVAVPAAAEFQISQSADADSGDAMVGGYTVGNIAISAGDDADAEAWLYQRGGTEDGGDLSFGDAVVGDVTISADDRGYAYISIEKTGSVDEEGDSIDLGNVSVGDVSVMADVSGTAGFGLHLSGYNDSVSYEDVTLGNVSIGNVAVAAGIGGLVDFWNTMEAGAVGDVSYGDVSLTVGKSGTLDDAYIDVMADTSDIGDVTVGDISVSMGDSASEGGDVRGISLSALSDIGDITIGDVTLEVGMSATLDDFDIYAYAGDTVGDVSIGDVTLTAVGDSAELSHTLELIVEDEIKSVEIGDVSLLAKTYDYVGYGVFMSASTEDELEIGDVSIGDVSMAAEGTSSEARFDVLIGGEDNVENVGDVMIGDMSLTANGSTAAAGAYVGIFGDETVGTTTIGDLDLQVANTENASAAATVSVTVETEGDLVVGDISLTQGTMDGWGPTTGTNPADMLAYVNLDSIGGDLSVGDITVTGGYETSGGDANDNYDMIGGTGSWLTLDADGDITVGDIDYSGYERAATIDVSAWDGAGEIKAAQDDTVIVLNDSQNAVTLYDGDDLVSVGANAVDPTDEGAIDSISGFTSGTDQVEVDLTGAITYDLNNSASDYADFLSNADTANDDIYSASFGGNTYVAFDEDGNGSVDFVVELVGVTSVTTGDFATI